MRNSLIILFTVLFLSGASTYAQELNCKVTIRHDKLTGSGVDPQVFTSMEKSISEFMNNRKWTTDEFKSEERIECNFFINLISANVGGDQNGFSGTLSVQATRPVYNASYSSTIVNYVDKDFTFKYSQFNPLNFNDNRVNGIDALTSNLTATLAYYAYIIIGLDYDSFELKGGTAILDKAKNIVRNAPEGNGISGWKPVENNKNRYWIIDQLLNQRFEDVRSFWYMMHREGLDSMTYKPENARTRILTNIKQLYKVNRTNPSSILMQFIFNAKSNEFIHLLELTPKKERPQYITLLSVLDVANSAKYKALQ